MAFYVKVIPPIRRARIHEGSCRHCRDGQGQANQDKGTGPTYWAGPYEQIAKAEAFMADLGPRYTDTGQCPDCMRGLGGI